ncbi:IclR family transcriptional regulator [Variovorax sp. RTB1]|uniref:IclR family transcriptional regulator n=1 Tax=Variovorax sp. RTB1 TaxID=3048631 RepID=UPI002B22D5AD|nr:IclR family transcriptional regulator [Variovorax sp. RTB1]MEB0113774.1 IclR family transcriptional regulator [Variovorax sp. RTB1]
MVAKTRTATDQAKIPPQGGESRSGTQSIERVVDVLRVIASRGRRGMRVGEVVATSGLAEATCFRMLRRLELEGMLDRDPHSKKYFLGPLLHELGLLARPRYRLAELCDATLQRLAEFTQDTVYLSERSGLEAVCANRALGDFPIKSLSLDIGVRRPLGVGAGGLAILCALPASEAHALVEANAHRYEKFASFTADFLYGAIAEGRKRGYSFLEGAVTPGTASIGVAFPPDNPVAAISVAAIAGRLLPERRQEIARQMHREVEKLVVALAAAKVSGDMAATDVTQK